MPFRMSLQLKLNQGKKINPSFVHLLNTNVPAENNMIRRSSIPTIKQAAKIPMRYYYRKN
jgi:hypothetical protein